MAQERLQKLLARAGADSRRACEELIAAGRVTVNGQVVTTPGVKADLGTDDVRLDGQRLRPGPPEYWILNKPKGVVCTNDDPAGRRRPVDLVRGTTARLFPVGRLDADSKGLLLLTNDGEFANRLAHPRYGVPKTYMATVGGRVTGDDIRHMLRGVYLAGGRARTGQVQILKRGQNRSIIRITLREGRNRHIRRVLARLGHPVRELVRTRLGRIGLRGVGVGKARRLTDEEIQYLKALPDEAAARPAPPAAKPSAAATPSAPRRAERPRPAKPPAPGRADRPRPAKGRRDEGRSRGRGDGRKPKKGSYQPHDADGTGKAGKGHRRDAGRGGRRPARPGRGPPRRGPRPRGRPPQ